MVVKGVRVGVENGVLGGGRKGDGVVGGGKKGDRVVGGIRGGAAKGGTHHLINVGNSRHIFNSSPDNESFKKKFPTRRFLPSHQ